MEKTVIDLSPVQARVATCKAIAWDTCHKIYVIMDDKEVSKMIELGYEGDMLKASEHTPEILMNSILDWYANACDLVFITAVSSNPIDDNSGFEALVEQSF